MTRDDLLPFCAASDADIADYRGLDKPWEYGGHVYATDTKIAARLPGGDPSAERPPGVPRAHLLYFWEKFPLPGGDALAGVGVPDEPAAPTCPRCGCDCPTCEDSVEFKEPVEVSLAWFGPRYLRLVVALPGLRSAVTLDPKGRPLLLFQSNDLCGALMALDLSSGKAAPK